MDGDSLQCCQAPAEMDKPAIIPFISGMFIKQNFGYFGKKLQFHPLRPTYRSQRQTNFLFKNTEISIYIDFGKFC